MVNEQNFKLKKDGTPNKYCYCRTPELIENYDKAIADNTQIWQCHHRLETHNSDGERRLVDISRSELIALDVYYNRPATELIFLTRSDHASLHHKGKRHSDDSYKRQAEKLRGRTLSEDHKKKISEAHKDIKPMLGKKMSEESKQKMRKAHKGKLKSEETKQKMSVSKKGFHKGMHWKLVDGKRVWY